MSTINEAALTTLGQRMARDSLRAFVAANPDLRERPIFELEEPLAAMRTAARAQVDFVVEAVRNAPWLAERSYGLAVTLIASAGTAALHAENQRRAAP